MGSLSWSMYNLIVTGGQAEDKGDGEEGYFWSKHTENCIQVLIHRLVYFANAAI